MIQSIIRHLFIFSSLLCTISSFSQELPQRGFLGIAAVPNGAGSPGLLIQQVIPGSTAARAGLQAADELLAINGEAITSQQSFLALAARMEAGQSLTFLVRRKGSQRRLKGKVQARPLPFSEDMAWQLSSFPHKNGRTRAVTLRARGTQNSKGTIYFIQGYPCFSMAYLPKEDSYVSAIEALARKGYTVYFVEKPGMGDAVPAGACASMGFDGELEVFDLGYQHLRRQLSDTTPVFLFGHSLGGVVAPILATRYQTAGVIVYGTVLKRWHDYLLDLLREQVPLKGKDYADAEDSLEVYRPLLHELFVRGQSPSALVAAHPLNQQRLQDMLQYDGRDQLIGRHYTFWQELNKYNLTAYWKQLQAPVLSLFGESDVAALKPEDMERIVEVVNHYHPGKGTYLFVPQTNHDMVRTGTMQDNMRIQFTKEYMQLQKENFNHELMERITDWMGKQSAVRPREQSGAVGPGGS